MIEQYFLTPVWLYALIAALVLLIFYLIRPKPTNKDIPALMFIIKESEKAVKGSWFRKLLVDPILPIQLLILILIALAMAEPLMQVNQKSTIEKSAIIIDASASMLADEGVNNRFDQAKNIARDYLSSRNLIIQAGDVALAIDDDLTKQEANLEISKLNAAHTRTDLAQAINLAAANLGAGSQMVIISDFIETKLHADYVSAIAKAKAQGIHIITKKVGEAKDNVGIIAMQADSELSFIQLKNYGAKKTVNLDIGGLSKDVFLEDKGTEVVEFETAKGVTKIEIKNKDALDVDNQVYLANYAQDQIKVLVISSEEKESEDLQYLKTALDVNEELIVDYAIPPKIDVAGYDVYIIKNVKTNSILPGTIKDIQNKVQKGASLIVFAQPGLFALNFDLPITYIDSKEETPVIISENLGFVRDINFGMVPTHFNVKARPGAITVAESSEESPLIVYQHKGAGKILYYGLMQDQFHLDLYYPIFWKRAIDFLIGREELSRINVRTGAILSLPEPQKVKTPSKTLTTQLVYFDQVGIYTVGDQTYSANLLSEKESDLSKDITVSEDMIFSEKEYKDNVPKEIAENLLWLALFLAALEILVLKLRGDF